MDEGARERVVTRDQPLRPSDSGFFEAIVATSADPIAVVDSDFVLRYVSASITSLLAYEPADYLNHSIAHFLEPDSLDAAVTAMEDLKRIPADPEWVGVPLRMVLRDADGSKVPVDLLARDVSRTGVDGYVVRIHRAGAALALHDTVDAILAGDDLGSTLSHLADYTQHSITRSIVSLGVGWDGDQFSSVVGDRTLLDFTDLAEADRRAIDAAVTAHAAVTDVFDQLDPSTRRHAAESGRRACWCAPITGPDADAALIVWHEIAGPPPESYRRTIERSVNLTALALQWVGRQRRLAWDVAHDPLTKLANRTQFAKALANSSGEPRAVLFCDLDDFKPVNETLGHRTGDRVLAAAAGRIAGACKSCVVARMGGDEFAVLVAGIGDQAAALHIASRVQQAFSNPITIDGTPSDVGVTIGAVFDPRGDATADQLLETADRLMRDGKTAGKNRILSAHI